MGYYVKTIEHEFNIPAENIPAAFEAVKALNTDPAMQDKKTGGSWSGGKKTATWFAWMTEDYHETCESLSEVMEMLGFEGSSEDEDGYTFAYYDSKTGQESLFLEALAPYVKDGSYILWHGEDGLVWRDGFALGKMVEI